MADELDTMLGSHVGYLIRFEVRGFIGGILRSADDEEILRSKVELLNPSLHMFINGETRTKPTLNRLFYMAKDETANGLSM